MNVTKNREANALRAEADKLRAKLVDPAVQLTQDEIEQTAAGVLAYERRAAMVAEFTPEAEIERQGGDAAVRTAAPEGEPEAASHADEYAALNKSMVRAFGGVGGYLRALAQRLEKPMSGAQARVHAAIESFHQRAIVGTASDASGGEFLLPLQQAGLTAGMEVVQPGILSIARRYPVQGRTLRIPQVVQTDATSKTRPLSGISAVGIIGEGSSITEKTPSFEQKLLTVYKYAAYTEMSLEMLADDFTGQLAPEVQRLIGGDILNSINDHMTISGSGSSQPLGALHTSGNASLVKHVRATASTVAIADVFGMYSKFTMTGGAANMRWFVNRTALPQLLSMSLSAGSAVTFLPSLNGAPVMSLLGIPVEVCDMMAVLGTEGDLALVNGAFYAAAIRQELTVESSIHFKFQTGVTAYRFIARAGGIPLPSSTYAYKAASDTKVAPHSPFVVLDEAAA
jgi:HK97 family phage major capsid protein